MEPFDLENGPRLRTGLNAPDGYFDALEDRIMAKIAKHDPKPKVIPMFARHRKSFFAAAAVLAIALMLPFYNYFTASDAADIDESALEDYLAYESGLNQFDLISGMEQEDIDDLKSDSELPVSDEAIEDALSGNNIEHILTE